MLGESPHLQATVIVQTSKPFSMARGIVQHMYMYHMFWRSKIFEDFYEFRLIMYDFFILVVNAGGKPLVIVWDEKLFQDQTKCQLIR